MEQDTDIHMLINIHILLYIYMYIHILINAVQVTEIECAKQIFWDEEQL